MSPQDPEKTVHEDVGLTAATSIVGPVEDWLRGSPIEVTDREPETFELPEKSWTWGRVAIAAAIVAVAAGELAWVLSSRDSLAARRRATAVLSESEKAALEAKRERFEKLDPTEQARLRALQAELAEDASPESLYSTLEDYLKWKSQLAPQESAMLAGLAPSERTARVVAVAGEKQTEETKRFSDADSKKLITWLELEIRTHQARILEHLPPPVRERFENMGDRERSWALMYHLLSARGSGPRLEEFATDLPKLRAQLSPAAQARWDAAMKSKEGFRNLLTDWVRQSVERCVAQQRDGGKPYQQIADNELRKFFEHKLPEAERQRLLSLPPEEMAAQLKREYLRNKGMWKEHGGKPGPYARQPFGSADDPRSDGFRYGPGGPGDRRPPGDGPPPPPPPRDGEFRSGDMPGGDRGMQKPRRDREENPEKENKVKKPTSERKPDPS